MMPVCFFVRSFTEEKTQLSVGFKTLFSFTFSRLENPSVVLDWVIEGCDPLEPAQEAIFSKSDPGPGLSAVPN